MSELKKYNALLESGAGQEELEDQLEQVYEEKIRLISELAGQRFGEWEEQKKIEFTDEERESFVQDAVGSFDHSELLLDEEEFSTLYLDWYDNALPEILEAPNLRKYRAIADRLSIPEYADMDDFGGLLLDLGYEGADDKVNDDIKRRIK